MKRRIFNDIMLVILSSRLSQIWQEQSKTRLSTVLDFTHKNRESRERTERQLTTEHSHEMHSLQH